MKNYSYSKESQIARTFRRHRDPVALRAHLSLRMPTSEAESAAERYGRCAVPGCPSYGTLDRPLDLHHIIPRSQLRQRINDFTNHLYLCGDWFPFNHHKALRQMCIRDSDKIDCDNAPVMATSEQIEQLRVLASTDVLGANILLHNYDVFFEYAIKKGVISFGITVTLEQFHSIKNSVKESSLCNPISRILKR